MANELRKVGRSWSGDVEVARATLQQEAAVVHAIPLTDLRVWDAVQTILPSAGANDDLGLVVGTYLTSAPTLQSGDSKAATTARYARFQFAVPEHYVAGQAITLRINAGMLTTVSDTTAALDAFVVRAAAPSTDICATAAQSINSLTAANIDFTITPTNVVVGDILDVRVLVSIVDGATGTAVIGAINSISLLMATKG